MRRNSRIFRMGPYLIKNSVYTGYILSLIHIYHGDGMASHRMVTKHISFYDEMTNVPFIFAGPGIKQQKKPVDQLLTQPTLDLLPTLCDLAGISVPVEKQGISLAPTLKGEKQKKTHPYVVSEWHSEYELSLIHIYSLIRSSRSITTAS